MKNFPGISFFLFVALFLGGSVSASASLQVHSVVPRDDELRKQIAELTTRNDELTARIATVEAENRELGLFVLTDPSPSLVTESPATPPPPVTESPATFRPSAPAVEDEYFKSVSLQNMALQAALRDQKLENTVLLRMLAEQKHENAVLTLSLDQCIAGFDKVANKCHELRRINADLAETTSELESRIHQLEVERREAMHSVLGIVTDYRFSPPQSGR
jgi:cell division protein FtsB